MQYFHVVCAQPFNTTKTILAVAKSAEEAKENVYKSTQLQVLSVSVATCIRCR